jgi:hypothetical protein
MERLELEVALCVPTVTVIGPVAAPAGTVKARLVFVGLETGGDNVPPPWLATVTCG